jgi:hypothetical protein
MLQALCQRCAPANRVDVTPGSLPRCLHIASCASSLNTAAEHHEAGYGSVAADFSGDHDHLMCSTSPLTHHLMTFQLILSGKVDPETPDVYAAIMASSSSVTRHHPDLARGGNSEYVQDLDTTRLRTLKFHNVESAASESTPAVARTISHLVYVDPLSPPGRLLLVETLKARPPPH